MPHTCDFCGCHEDVHAATAWRATADQFRRNCNELREQNAQLRTALEQVISLFDYPCPYDSVTTLASGRALLSSPGGAAPDPYDALSDALDDAQIKAGGAGTPTAETE